MCELSPCVSCPQQPAHPPTSHLWRQLSAIQTVARIEPVSIFNLGFPRDILTIAQPRAVQATSRMSKHKLFSQEGLPCTVTPSL